MRKINIPVRYVHENPLPLGPRFSPNRSTISPSMQRSPNSSIQRSMDLRVHFSGSPRTQPMHTMSPRLQSRQASGWASSSSPSGRMSPRLQNRQASGWSSNSSPSARVFPQENTQTSPRRRRNRRGRRSKRSTSGNFSHGIGRGSSSHGSRSQDRSFSRERPAPVGSPRGSGRHVSPSGSYGRSSSNSPLRGGSWRSPSGSTSGGTRSSPSQSARSSPRRSRRPTVQSVLSEIPNEFMKIWRFLADNGKYELIHFKAIIQGYSSKVYERLASRGYKIMPKETLQQTIEEHIENMAALEKNKPNKEQPLFVGPCSVVKNSATGKIEKVMVNYKIPGVLVNHFLNMKGRYASEFLPRIFVEMMAAQYCEEFGQDSIDPKVLHQHLERIVKDQINKAKAQRSGRRRPKRDESSNRDIKISNQNAELRGKPIPELPIEFRWSLAMCNEKKDTYKLDTLRKVIYGYWLQKFCEVKGLSCPPLNPDRFEKDIDGYILAANAKNDEDAKKGIKWKDMLAKSSILKEIPLYILELNLFLDEIYLPYSYHLRNVVLELMSEVHQASTGQGPCDLAIFNKVYASDLKKLQEQREAKARASKKESGNDNSRSPGQNSTSTPQQ